MQPLPPSDAHDPEALLDLLRRFALAEQGDQPRVFHSIRCAARHFGVPSSAMARIYRRLADDGILRTVRGSGTVLQAIGSRRTLCVHGLVGVPVFMPSFLRIREYRNAILRLRRELRARGFAAASVFYESSAVDGLDCLEPRLLQRGFDSVIWLRPDRLARDMAAHLQDRGMRVLGISDGCRPCVPCRYVVRRERAIQSVVKQWQSAGVSLAVVVRAADIPTNEQLLLRTVTEAGLATRGDAPAAAEHMAAFLDSIHEPVVLPVAAAAACASRAPEALARLMRRVRVLLIGGVPNFPCSEVPDVTADLVTVDWQLVAEQVAADLLNGTAFTAAVPQVFEATAQMHAPLRSFAQTF